MKDTQKDHWLSRLWRLLRGGQPVQRTQASMVLHASDGNSIAFQISNPEAENKPVIFKGIKATLDVALVNQTGSDLTLSGGTDGSSLTIYMPMYFTAAEVQQMQIINLSQSGWKGSYDSVNNALLLSRSETSGTWANGDSLTFGIAQVLASAEPTTDFVQINFMHIEGSNVPSQLTASLALNNPDSPSRADLADVLQSSLDNDGDVYVSSSVNPLTNVLYLTLKNVGKTPIYKGNTMWTGTPQVIVTFVYGRTSGAIAPSVKSNTPPEGSAWNISGSVFADQTGGWQITNPSVTGQANAPQWILQPVATNQQIIGTGDQSNVVFAFDNLISFTPPGPTQMYLQFTGFSEDETTPYNDFLCVVGITKKTAPDPSVLDIWSPVDDVVVTSAEETIQIPLTWSMFGVGSVRLNFNIPGLSIPDKVITYSNAHPPLNTDSYTLECKGIESSRMLTAYCFAYADTEQHQSLNKVECTVPLVFTPVIHSFTIENIPTAPPYSNTCMLEWDIAGQASFQITAQSGEGNPVVLPVPATARSYKVYPTEPKTTYTLTIFGPDSDDDNLRTMSKPELIAQTSADVTVTIEMPIGTITAYAGSNVPNGWLLCNGQPITQTDYPGLYGVLGAGNVPDLQSRFIVGAGQGSGMTNYPLNATGGAEVVTLTLDQIPSHKHNINNGDFGIHHRSFDGNNDDDKPFETHPDGVSLGGTDAAGGGQAHENRPPYYALSYIIKY